MREILHRLLADRALQFYFFATLTILIPALVLGVLGLAYIWREGWFLWFGLGMFTLASISTILRLLLMRDQREKVEEELDEEFEHLSPIADWSKHDNEVWRLSLKNISERDLVETPWPDIWDAMLLQIAFVAQTYNKNEKDARLAFTVPEALLMLEKWSREYRPLVLENVPLVQEVRISTMVSGSREFEKWNARYKSIKPLVDVIRVVVSKGVALPSAIASTLASEFGGHLTNHMQGNLKQLLFEQVSQVAIDLYSGRLKLSEAELALYRKGIAKPELTEINPLTVMLVGQVNAGKSSLINALSDQCVAETDLLPATDGFARYRLTLSEGLEIDLVDSPGLDGKDRISDLLLDQAVKADLLIWVSQATQQAKSLDRGLIDQWDAYFDKELGRKKPPILLVTTHNDMLPPVSDWNPPYDLEYIESPKVESMLGALAYTRQALGLDKNSPAVAIALPQDDFYNVDMLKDVLNIVSEEGRAAQLNRERVDAAYSAPVVLRGLKQAGAALKSSLAIAFR
ncbi:MAG: GTPase domain-containing protein [Halioglobus sp.]